MSLAKRSEPNVLEITIDFKINGIRYAAQKKILKADYDNFTLGKRVKIDQEIETLFGQLYGSMEKDL